jgi:hypothetical protein
MPIETLQNLGREDNLAAFFDENGQGKHLAENRFL